MILIDANLLIYAYNADSAQHEAAKIWVERVFAGTEQVGLSWDTIHAFLRITTMPALFEKPLPTKEAAAIVDTWLRSSNVVAIAPGVGYWSILSELLSHPNIRGARVADAQIAALAVENNALLCSADRDFERFPAVRVTNPLR